MISLLTKYIPILAMDDVNVFYEAVWSFICISREKPIRID